MARVGTKKKKMRLFQEFKESLEQQAPTRGLMQKLEVRFPMFAKEEPAAQKVSAGLKHVTARLRKSP